MIVETLNGMCARLLNDYPNLIRLVEYLVKRTNSSSAEHQSNSDYDSAPKQMYDLVDRFSVFDHATRQASTEQSSKTDDSSLVVSTPLKLLHPLGFAKSHRFSPAQRVPLEYTSSRYSGEVSRYPK